MPIEGSAGTLDIENATLRSRNIVSLTSMVAGNDVVRDSAAPALEVYGDPSHGGNEARLELVSNTAAVSSAFTRLTSNAGVFSIETGTDASDNGTITFGGFSNERLRITSDGKVGVGTTDPSQGDLTVYALGADPYFSGYVEGAYAAATDFTGLAHLKSSGSHGVIRISNSSDNTGSTRIDFNTKLSDYWGVNTPSASYFRGTAPAAGRIMVAGEIANNYEDAYMSFHTCRDLRTDGAGGTGNLYERMRITSDGKLGIGITNPPENLTVQDPGIEPTFGLRRKTYNDYAVYMKNTTGSFTTVTTSDDTVLNVGKGSGSNRSINALGTINASGTDYAEYMKKSRSDLVIKKGDIVGINNVGELTNVFSESIQFVVKSTNPSYVGGDSWKQGTINTPKYPSVLLRVDEYSNISSQDANLYSYWEEQNLYANTEQLNEYYEENEKYLEDKNIHRDPYDRIAYCGQVPVNVYNATPGQYIVPSQANDDTISCELTNTPTFEQYQISIGKVIKIQEDGRAWAIVKIS
jgi:hypothetical protein